MTDWHAAPVFGEPTPDAAALIRPSAYGIISDGLGRLALIRTPLGLYLPGGGSDAEEVPDATVVRETREESGLTVRVGVWRRMAIEHVYSVTEQMHYEKRSTFCNATAIEATGEPIETDHALEWTAAAQAPALLTPEGHRWAVSEWLASGGPTG